MIREVSTLYSLASTTKVMVKWHAGEQAVLVALAQGGNWGAGTTTALAQIMPPGLVGIHLSWQFVFPEQIPEQLSFEEKRAVEGAKFFLGEGNGYFRQQSTRPQTVGYGLADSPAGQALWIYEKFQAWTDNNGLPEDALSLDQMLDNISIYWFTNSAASSARIYWENRGASFSRGKAPCPLRPAYFRAKYSAHPKAGRSRPTQT